MRTGWAVTIWFHTEGDALRAAHEVGKFMTHFEKEKPTIESLIRVLEHPSMALEVGRKETKIPARRKGPCDR